MKIVTLLTLVLCMSTQFSRAQTATKFPFPQNVEYTQGNKSAHITDTEAMNAYTAWKQKFIRECGENEARVVKEDSTITVSEGIGYGLAITAYAGDKIIFDKLLNYYMARLNERGLMNWIYTDCETGNNKKNGATDGDLDAAIALLVAMKQWPTETSYADIAHAIIDSLQTHNFLMCEGIIVQKPGDDFGGCNCTNPSYYSPAYYRAFAQFKEDHTDMQGAAFWLQAAEDSYVTLNRNTNPHTGLVYAWTNHKGGDPENCYYEVSGSGVYNSYQYDACRTPWRIATDYLWWGTKEAEVWTQNITTFIETPIYNQFAEDGEIWYGAGGIENVVDNYWHNGLRRINPDAPTYGHRHSVPFVGSFALAAMSSSQRTTDRFMREFASVPAERYYESCLQVLYMFLASGNFWNPYGVE
ncbi:MAG: glycosyl hydrolase family 8 [Bacteroidales bacterium]